MRRSFYDKIAIGAVIVTITIGAAIVYAQPSNWKMTVATFTLLSVLCWSSLKVCADWAEKNGGFSDVSGDQHKSMSEGKSKPKA